MRFEILGDPVGEGRPRTVRMGSIVRVHAAPKSAQWREAAKAKKAVGEKATIKQIYGAALLDLRACGGLKATAYKKLDTYTPKAVDPVAELPRAEESQPQSAGSRHRSAS